MNAISMQRFLEKLGKESLYIIDIRDPFQYQKGYIKTAINIPANNLLKSPKNYLEQNKTYYIYCQSGYKSKLVSDKLNDLGYHTITIIGGYQQYLKNK